MKKGERGSKSFFCRVRDAFSVFARKSSNLLGSAWAFVAAIDVILLWAATGPAFHYSDTWQLIINTGTSIVTVLMVFLIQNTPNGDAKAVHVTLAELIRSHEPARDILVDLEKLANEKLTRLEQEFGRLRQGADAGAYENESAA